MIYKQFYFSDQLEEAQALCGLAVDEIEQLWRDIGKNPYFTKQSRFKGLKGKAVELMDGRVQVRTCFGQKILWRQDV